MNTEKRLKNIMTTSLTVVNLNTSFNQVKRIFDENKFHHLPVVDQYGRIKGIISKSDFTSLTYRLSKETSGPIYSAKSYEKLSAEDLMTANPVFLNAEDEIGLAANLFLENVYHAVLVVEEEQLVGIVTTHDLLAWAFCGGG